MLVTLLHAFEAISTREENFPKRYCTNYPSDSVGQFGLEIRRRLSPNDNTFRRGRRLGFTCYPKLTELWLCSTGCSLPRVI